MTARSLPSLRDASLLLFASFLTAAFVFQTTKATPTNRSHAERPEPRTVNALPPVSLNVEATSVSISDAPETSSPTMPLERDIQALQGLRDMLKNGDAETRRKAAHQVSDLASLKKNDPYLSALHPALEDLLFDYSAPTRNRLMALAAFYKVSPEEALLSMNARIDQEPSDRVRTTMENIIRGAWTPEMGLLQFES